MPRFSLLVPLMLFASVLTHQGAHAADVDVNPYRLSLSKSQQQQYRLAPYRPDQDDEPVLEVDDARPYARQIAFAAQAVGLDPELVHAIVAVESAYRSAVVSPKGAVGLMQVLPETGQLHGVRNLADPAENLRAGTRHLSHLMVRFDHNLDLVLAAYNAGEGAVWRYNNSVPPFAETRSYVPAVAARYAANRFRAASRMPSASRLRNYR